MSDNLTSNDLSVGLIGAGPMAVSYVAVFKALGVDFQVFGRGEGSADAFENKTGIRPFTGSLKDQLEGHTLTHAVVAVGVQDLATATRTLCEAGVNSILVEKPAAVDAAECKALAASISSFKGEILIAYNRRFYPGVSKARSLIEQDGGATSALFRFTELAWKLKDIEKDPRVKGNWLFANSTHVIDMAFDLAGWPKQLHAASGGELDWHPAGARFVGHGVTEQNAHFSYHADWNAPGGWGVEIMTAHSRLIFQPLETLQVQKLGSFAVETINLGENPFGEGLKPGLTEMVDAFVRGEAHHTLPSLQDQLAHFEIYETIANGGSL